MLTTGITATYVIGSLQPSGTYLFRFFGTWDGVTANLQYSEDDGATWRDVSVAGLKTITVDMTDPVSIVVAADAKWQLELDTPGASTDLSLWYSYAGS